LAVLRNTGSFPEAVDAPASLDDVPWLAPRHGSQGALGVPSPTIGSARHRSGVDLRGVRRSARVEVSPSEAAERLSMNGSGIVVELVRTTDRLDFRYRGHSHLLVAYEQGVPHGGEKSVDRKSLSMPRDLARKLTFVPAGHDYRERHQLHASGRILYVYLDPAVVDVQARPGQSSPLPARTLFDDDALRSTVEKIRSLMGNPRSENSAYLGALGAVLMHELTRLNRAPDSGDGLARGGLAAWQQRLVSSYIDEHVSEHIPLATLARLARLSPYHFSRAFKKSFGVPPHRYHTNRRIDRAKTLLERRTLSVTEIGLALGFSETSSFTAAFRKTTGLTPSRYHRSIAYRPAQS
jgi:AraC family transcriptional regulator